MLQAISNGKVTSAPDKYTYESAMEETIGNFFSEAGVLNLYGTGTDGSVTDGGEKVFDENGNVILNPLSCYNDTAGGMPSHATATVRNITSVHPAPPKSLVLTPHSAMSRKKVTS